MKKEKFLIAGLLVVLVLAFGLVLASCDDGARPDDYDHVQIDQSGAGNELVAGEELGGKPSTAIDHGTIAGLFETKTDFDEDGEDDVDEAGNPYYTLVPGFKVKVPGGQ